MRLLPLALGTALLAGLSAAVFAGREASPPDVEAYVKDLNLGTHWSGAKITKDDLFGKVVLVELWGS